MTGWPSKFKARRKYAKPGAERVSCACIMSPCDLNCSWWQNITASIKQPLSYNSALPYLVRWRFPVHPFVWPVPLLSRSHPPLLHLHLHHLSLWIKMSLAVQLWLTPSAPHPTPAEQLPPFDESGPACLPPPLLPVRDAWQRYPSSKRSSCLRRGKRRQHTHTHTYTFPPPFHRALQNLVEKKGGRGDNCHVFFFFFPLCRGRKVLCSAHPEPTWCMQESKQERHAYCTVPRSSG